MDPMISWMAPKIDGYDRRSLFNLVPFINKHPYDDSYYAPVYSKPVNNITRVSNYTSSKKKSKFTPVKDKSKFSKYNVRGFSYCVSKEGKNGYEMAVRLHELNSLAIDIIGYIRRFLMAAKKGMLHPKDKNININKLEKIYSRLRRKYNVDNVFESLIKHEGTSYVVNNGEEIHMCVRGPSSNGHFISLIIVLTHELSHVGSSTPYHDKEFWENYNILQKIVSKMGIITPKMVPKTDLIHCNKIKITRDELNGLIEKPQNMYDVIDNSIEKQIPNFRVSEDDMMKISNFRNVKRDGSIRNSHFQSTEYPLTTNMWNQEPKVSNFIKAKTRPFAKYPILQRNQDLMVIPESSIQYKWTM